MAWFILVRAWSELGYGLVMVVCTSEPAFTSKRHRFGLLAIHIRAAEGIRETTQEKITTPGL